MGFLVRGNAKIFFEDYGKGDPVIAVHGLIENNLYWGKVSAAIAESFRFIPMEMRGHGRTKVDSEPFGFDEQTVGDDIIALADHLGLKRFHLVTHSTGGFVGSRYAMRNSPRLASLILTDTASSTSVIPADPETIRVFHHKFARQFEKYDWDQIFAGIRVNPAPFFRGIMEGPNADELMRFAREMVGMGDRPTIAAFIRSFYTDPDPMIEGLKKIACPTLVVYGDKDDLFIESSRLMASNIPGAKIVEYKGAGHMTAIEVPGELSRDIVAFMAAHPA